ncbi:hypothetical protein BDF19DRAFT_39561 [Syncephalis fuscata]|nr:hypothetical protein BDF19DRAFT_39561 [Syncephalis fuscata]
MTTTTIQCQTLLRILISWSDDDLSEKMSSDDMLDCWCRLIDWMISQQAYTWCYATRLYLYKREELDFDELDRRVLDLLATSTTGHVPYLYYCLLASDLQLVAKAVTDIRADFMDTQKAETLLSDVDLPILLCARSMITELVSTPMLASAIDSMFVCPCRQEQEQKQHAWRRLLIGQVALNMELAGYDEISADIAARYLQLPNHVDSLAVRASIQRAMETAATNAEHEAHAEHWQPPLIYQLDNSIDRHTLHRWMVHQFMQ